MTVSGGSGGSSQARPSQTDSDLSSAGRRAADPRVSLVGAGPGDPGLVTVKGRERLRAADVVVFDRLAAPALLDEVPPGAAFIDVGKAPGRAAMSQEEINSVLVAHGRAGRRVVRLKGGDPFVFGRGGEEALALIEAGVAFEVIPGVTSAFAGPAAAGIPVTHRAMATSVTVVAGHEGAAKAGSQTNWDAIARTGGTICVLMGVGNLAPIVNRLVAAGRAPSTPAAAVMWGTTGRQRVVRATLGELPGVAGIEAPAVLVIGDVSALDVSGVPVAATPGPANPIPIAALPGAELLPPESGKPLAGRTIVVTRAREHASALRLQLEALGAEVVEFPTIAFAAPTDPGGLDAALGPERLRAYGWVCFTSPTGVTAAFAALARAGRDARALGDVRVAVIGPGTAAALHRIGVTADLVPPEFIAESLANAFPDPARAGESVLILRAEDAREALPEMLRERGYAVDVVGAYRTILGAGDDVGRERLARGHIDAVTFTASSTVRNFVELAGGDIPHPRVVASIGPITSATARELGWDPTVEASEHTIDGLVAAVASALAGGNE